MNRRSFLVKTLLYGGLSAAFSGCSMPSTFKALNREIQSLGSRRKQSVDSKFLDLRGVAHLHTDISHDSRGTFGEILNAARGAGLHFVITTDHNSPRIFEEGPVGWREDLLVLRGAEIGKEGNYLLAFPLKTFIDADRLTFREIVDAIHDQGGMAVAAHPDRFREWEDPGLDGMEIYDLYDNATQTRWRYPGLLIDLLSSFNRYPDEVVASILRRPEKALRVWDTLTRKRRVFGIGTPDAHQNLRILGKQIDDYSRTLRFVNLHLLARSWSHEEVLLALREGRGYTSFDLLADPTGFSFAANSPGPDPKTTLMGEERPFEPGLTLKASLPLKARITLIRDGVLLRTEIADEMTHEVLAPGVYRIECALELVGRFWPWIISNPIYLRGGRGIL